MGNIRHGGIGVIEEGNLKGRNFIIPAEVLVAKGEHSSGATEYSLACLVHQRFVQQTGCPDCAREVADREAKNAAIGL